MRSGNRWVILSKIIPWEEIEKEYSKQFSKNGMGAPAKSARVALGSLIIKEKLGLSDEETVEQICENPYLQYFLGFDAYRDEVPFDSSMMVHFRKRFGLKTISKFNDIILRSQKKPIKRSDKKKDDGEGKGGSSPGKGKFIIDTTCAPADIRFPTDLSLLNEAREKAEHIIDVLYIPLRHKEGKPRTYRRKARKDYFKVAKKKRVRKKEIVRAIGKQLRYLKRDLKHIREMASRSNLKSLGKKGYKDLLVINELYRQQKYMYDNKVNKIGSRIVSISQPHVRPMVRGKAAVDVEFGAKISISLLNGYSYLEGLSWEPYHESVDLIKEVERYKEKFGYYPESLHVDKIYRTRENIRYCKERGIRISGPALGRPKKEHTEDPLMMKKMKAKQKRDERYRIPIEGKIGQGKRRFSLKRIMAKLAITSETAIAVIFLVMNLEKLLTDILFLFFRFLNIFLRTRKFELNSGF